MKLGKEIEKGNQGTVYMGEYDGNVVAIKVINKYNQDWERELDILKKIDSQYIVKLIKYVIEDNIVYYIMEYIHRDLYTVIRNQISEEQALIYLKDIAKGVDYLHRINIIHRDIKPENVLVDSQNRTKICDFGHATTFQKGETFNTIMGTIFYFSPEVVSLKEYDYRIDIWALGIIYYEMIAQYPPFYAETDNEIYKLIKRNKVIFPNFFSEKTKINILTILKYYPENRPTISQILDFTFF
jgi:serine/threonine protein kinase